MDEGELLALLSGVRKTPILVCHIAPHLARAAGAHTTAVFLSPETTAKEESKHRAATNDLYRLAPAVLASRYVRIDPKSRKLIFVWHGPKDDGGKSRSYKAIVKATKAGHELYLVSLHRIDRTGVRAAFKKTISLREWETR